MLTPFLRTGLLVYFRLDTRSYILFSRVLPACHIVHIVTQPVSSFLREPEPILDPDMLLVPLLEHQLLVDLRRLQRLNSVGFRVVTCIGCLKVSLRLSILVA